MEWITNMWNYIRIHLGIRNRSFAEVLAKELYEANTQLIISKKQHEMWKASVVMYNERVKRIKKELADEINETGDPLTQ